NPFNPEDGFIATADFMFASPIFGGRDWWLRGELSWQQFLPIPRTQNRLNFRYALRYGHAAPLRGLPFAETTSIPEVWRYFGGGTVDRGIRGVTPETMLVDVEEIQETNGLTRLRYTPVGGHIRALGTLALQVVSVRDFIGGKLAHSLFYDFGILAQKWQHVQLPRDLRHSVGVNFVKWNIRIVTIAVGYAVLVPNVIAPGNVRPTDDQNGRFVFDVGVTF
ncbi:MAG: BamA/TamA family outer membrane protein, partial [Nannocystaceae bacterium]